jgi:hypothetical protein
MGAERPTCSRRQAAGAVGIRWVAGAARLRGDV